MSAEDLLGTQGPRKGILLLLSGPAGSGKSTLLRRALSEDRNLVFSISCTTRSPREGETDGQDYHFLSDDEFSKRVENNEFLEHAEVHKWRYGTLSNAVVDILNKGKDVIMDIDVQGADQVRDSKDPVISDALVDVFLTTSDTTELEKRLRGRDSEDEDTFQLRMQTAVDEIKRWRDYTYCILSGNHEEDFKVLSSILATERMRVSRMAT
ncbi:MAG: guanylate kinase [Candidatus Marinimicrobia bacterium]|nr:guanylate kinase [Candidatus Neomarinimicrobiota bacterium]NRB43246.1 guanylate kinase [Verrucomicrobiales bacterium]